MRFIIISLTILTQLFFSLFEFVLAQGINEIGSYNTPGRANKIFIRNNMAFIADGNEGLLILDISNPARPVRSGSFDTPGFTNDVYVVENLAFLAEGVDDGLRIIDVSDPSNPRELSSVETSGHGISVCVTGNYAFVAGGIMEETGYLTIVDISDPRNPQPVSELEFGAFYCQMGVASSEQIAYLAADIPGFQLIDYSFDPSDPFISDELNLNHPPICIFLADDIAYLGTVTYGMWPGMIGGGGLVIVDVSNPDNVDELGRIEWEDGAQVCDLFVSGELAFAANSVDGIRILDVSNQRRPEVISENNIGNCTGLKVDGSFIYATCQDRGLRVYELASAMEVSNDEINFGNVRVDESDLDVLTISSSGLADLVVRGISQNGDYYSTDFEGEVIIPPGETERIRITFTPEDDGVHEGWLIISSNDPEDRNVRVNLTGTGLRGCLKNTPGEANGVEKFNNHVFIADGEEGISIIDVTNPDDPQDVAVFDTQGFATAVAIVNDCAFVADGEEGLSVIDVYDLDDLALIGSLDTPGEAIGVTISGDYAYISDNNGGMRIVDISNPERPEEVGELDTRGQVFSIKILGQSAYLADGNRGIRIVDISQKDNPIEIGNFDTPNAALDLDIMGDLAFVADYEGGLRIIDISDTENMTEIGYIITPGNAEAVVVKYDYAYIADNEGGLCIVDITNPNVPVVRDNCYSPGDVRDVILADGRVYAASSDCGMMVFDLEGVVSVEQDELDSAPQTSLLLSVYPNPFNSTTTISYELPFSSDISLELFDLTGSKVLDLVSGNTQFGIHAININSGDLPSGIYFIRLNVSELVFTRKIMLIR